VSVIRQRTKNLVVSGIVGALVMGVVSTGGAAYMVNQQANEKKALRAEYENKIKDAEQLLKEQQATKKKVVVASKDLVAGVKITEGDVKIVDLPETGAPQNNLTDITDLVGKVVKIDVVQNTPLIGSMVFQEGATPSDLRSQEYNVMILPTKLEKGQFVDVRISFPTGQDYIVLSKKKVKDLSGTTVWYEVSESEILAMSSATVDAYFNGAKMYATTYADPFMQEKAIPNYPINLKVIDLVQTDPNVLERAKQSLNEWARTKLDKSIEETDEAKKTKYQSGVITMPPQLMNNQQQVGQNNATTPQSGTQSAPQNGSQSTPQTGPAGTKPGAQIPSSPLPAATPEPLPSTSQQTAPKEQIVQPVAPSPTSVSPGDKQKAIFEQPLTQ
jgi:hypothetical protein